jgi:hypothetical protein
MMTGFLVFQTKSTMASSFLGECTLPVVHRGLEQDFLLSAEILAIGVFWGSLMHFIIYFFG